MMTNTDLGNFTWGDKGLFIILSFIKKTKTILGINGEKKVPHNKYKINTEKFKLN